MKPGEKEAWCEVIDAVDLDAHMLAVGQAQANAKCLERFVSTLALTKYGRIAVIGAGTAQFMDLIRTERLVDHPLVFTDISERFRPVLEQRLRRFPALSWTWVQDDIENSKLSGPCEAAVLSLVLQHVDWRKAVDSLVRLSPKWIFVHEQRNRIGGNSTTKERPLPPTIRKYAEIQEAELIEEVTLTNVLHARGYIRENYCEEEVADQKVMYGVAYSKSSAGASR